MSRITWLESCKNRFLENDQGQPQILCKKDFNACDGFVGKVYITKLNLPGQI